MPYSKEIYNFAIDELKRRKQLAENQVQLRKNTFAALEPRYAEVIEELARTGSKTVRVIIERKSDASIQIQKLKEASLALQAERASLLEKHGYPPNYLDPEYTCSKCRDTGFTDGWMCSCLKVLMKEKAFAALNADTPLSLSGFDSFRIDYYPDTVKEGTSPRRIMEQVLKNCRWYADNFSLNSPSLLFQGATGLGKTHLSLAIASKAIEKGCGVVYGSVQEFMHKIEREHFKRDMTGSDTRSVLLDCDLLILDDLGTEFVTQFTVSTLYHLINSRLLSNKPTIISTNLTLSELEQKYSERIVSRIAGNYRMLRFAGNDIRMIKN